MQPAQRVTVNGPAIRAIRAGLGVPAQVLADEVGISYSYLASLENGTRRTLSPDDFRRLVFSLKLADSRAIIQNPYADYRWVKHPELEDAVPTP